MYLLKSEEFYKKLMSFLAKSIVSYLAVSSEFLVFTASAQNSTLLNP